MKRALAAPNAAAPPGGGVTTPPWRIAPSQNSSLSAT